MNNAAARTLPFYFLLEAGDRIDAGTATTADWVLLAEGYLNCDDRGHHHPNRHMVTAR